MIMSIVDIQGSEPTLIETTERLIHEDTATKVYEMVYEFFCLGFKDERDQKLFKIVFSADPKFDIFEFVDRNFVSYRIQISGDRELFHSDDEPEHLEPLEGIGRAIHATIVSSDGTTEQVIEADDLHETEQRPCVVALFNSETFIQYACSNKNLGCGRLFEVLEC